jgi:hypothetical protein
MMNLEIKRSLKGFLVELFLYSGLVVGYFFLVLKFLGHWLDQLYLHDRPMYAAVALGLMVGQGLVLEIVTRLMLKLIRPFIPE